MKTWWWQICQILDLYLRREENLYRFPKLGWCLKLQKEFKLFARKKVIGLKSEF
jgi:hypothetical protein